MAETHLFDLVLCIPLLWGIIRGVMRGLVFEIAILVALSLGLWGGYALAGYASVYLSGLFNVKGNWLHYLSFASVFIAIVVLIIVLGKLVSGAISMMGLGIFNRIGGAIFGLAKWILIVSAVIWLMHPILEKSKTSDGTASLKKQIESSYLYKPLLWLGKTMIPEKMNSQFFIQQESL